MRCRRRPQTLVIGGAVGWNKLQSVYGVMRWIGFSDAAGWALQASTIFVGRRGRCVAVEQRQTCCFESRRALGRDLARDALSLRLRHADPGRRDRLPVSRRSLRSRRARSHRLRGAVFPRARLREHAGRTSSGRCGRNARRAPRGDQRSALLRLARAHQTFLHHGSDELAARACRASRG